MPGIIGPVYPPPQHLRGRPEGRIFDVLRDVTKSATGADLLQMLYEGARHGKRQPTEMAGMMGGGVRAGKVTPDDPIVRFLRERRRSPEYELPYDQPPPSHIGRGTRGEPLEAYNAPPPIESFLGDQYLSRWIKSKQVAIGNVKKADDDEIAYIDKSIEDLEDRINVVEEGGVDSAARSADSLRQDLEMLRYRREQFKEEIEKAQLEGQYEVNIESALDSLQSAVNTNWLNQRQGAMSAPAGRHTMIKNWKQDIIDAERALGQAPNSLYAKGLRGMIGKRKHWIKQEQANIQRPPWHLPPKLNDRLNRPNTIRGGD